MKDTYWLVLVLVFGLPALGLCLGWYTGIWSARRKIQKDMEYFGLRGQWPERKRSIWTRDVFDNGFGRFLTNVVFPVLLLGYGIVAIVTGQARWKDYEYRGIDAVLIGIGAISLSLMPMAFTARPGRSPTVSKIQTWIGWLASVCFILCFSIALFRNI
jgi:hypothetical protein